MEEIAAGMYVDDLISGGYKKEEVTELKNLTNPTRNTMKQLNISSPIKSLQNHQKVKLKHLTTF